MMNSHLNFKFFWSSKLMHTNIRVMRLTKLTQVEHTCKITNEYKISGKSWKKELSLGKLQHSWEDSNKMIIKPLNVRHQEFVKLFQIPWFFKLFVREKSQHSSSTYFPTTTCWKQAETVQIVPVLLLGCSGYQGSSSQQNTMPETQKLKHYSTTKCYIKNSMTPPKILHNFISTQVKV